jgi:L-lysine exporter family protein LysE/ArgO
MIASFSEGFLLGLGAAIPLGPINILIMNSALKSYRTGVALGFGAMSADIFYLILILAGMAGFMNDPDLLNAIGVFGSLILLYLAYGIYKNRAKIVTLQTAAVRTKTLFKTYMQGFALTLLNPYTVIFWFSVAGYAANRDLHAGFTLLGMTSAITLWTTVMPYLVHRSKHKISQRASKYLSLFSAFILFGFALSLFAEVLFF